MYIKQFTKFLLNMLFVVSSSSVLASTHINLHEEIIKASDQHKIPAILLASVIMAESSGIPCSRSPVGAEGLLQFMSATAKSMELRDSFDPTQSVNKGAKLLRELLDRTNNNVIRALALYNAGNKAFNQSFSNMPKETQQYVIKINRYISTYQDNWLGLLPNMILATNREICEAVLDVSF